MTDDAPFSHAPFHTRYGFSRPESPGIALRIEPYEEICDRGVLRPTILVSAVDLVASLLVREIAGTDATFTSDLSLRAPCEWVPRRIDVRGEVMRSGKRLLTTAVRLEADGRDFAYAIDVETMDAVGRIHLVARQAHDLASLDLERRGRLVQRDGQRGESLFGTEHTDDDSEGDRCQAGEGNDGSEPPGLAPRRRPSRAKASRRQTSAAASGSPPGKRHRNGQSRRRALLDGSFLETAQDHALDGGVETRRRNSTGSSAATRLLHPTAARRVSWPR